MDNRLMLQEDDHVLGDRDASLVLVEYGDYHCPFTAAAQPLLHDLLDQNNDVCVVFRPFPLTDIHPESEIAACAAEAAARQGGFERVHEVLFDRYGSFDKEHVMHHIRQVGLDPVAFEADLMSTEIHDFVQKRLTEAEDFGIESSPTFFVNGKLLGGLGELRGFVRELQLKTQENYGTTPRTGGHVKKKRTSN